MVRVVGATGHGVEQAGLYRLLTSIDQSENVCKGSESTVRGRRPSALGLVTVIAGSTGDEGLRSGLITSS